MTKITLDDIEYDSEDFTEAQTDILQEIQYNSNVKRQLEYQLHSVSTLGAILVDRLKKSLTSETVPKDEDDTKET
jgi:hypothetical protein|tara:strand:+ start:458 stop:682 length:225 start_codon:yes stop_codon:yes gene_type:complete